MEDLQERALQNGHVLVAPPGAADENSRAGVSCGVAPRAEERMRTFDGRQNALALGAFGERIQGLVVRSGFINGPSAFHQVGMLGSDSGVIKAGGHRMSLPHLAKSVLQYQRIAALQDSGSPEGQRGRVVPEAGAAAARFHADKL